MKLKFKKRNEKGLHCRFCNARIDKLNPELSVNLYETSPVKGIVCEHCRKHLEEYLREIANWY